MTTLMAAPAVPGGAATKHLVNAEVLRNLGPEGYLINIARGTVVAQGAPEALRSGTGQAGLEDAFVQLIGSGEGLA